MSKLKSVKPPRSSYRCDACGPVESKWLGRCPACQEWNSLIEEAGTIVPTRAAAVSVADGGAPISIADVGDANDPTGIGRASRRVSGINELDRVLGGGLVAGSMVLLGGDPGVGKSTLLIQSLAGLARQTSTVLYATGEESVAQTAMRARRVGSADKAIALVAETDVDRIIAHAHASK